MSDEVRWQPQFVARDLQLSRTLGRGAFGEVFLVREKRVDEGTACESHSLLALKRMPLASLSESGVSRAISEAKLLHQLAGSHECILHCLDFQHVVHPVPALELLLEFAPLGDLSERIRKQKGSESCESSGIPEIEAVSYSRDIASGLAHIHSLQPKVIHRDIKPANVVLFPPDDDKQYAPRAKLADFGIAKVLETEGPFAAAETVIGTPHYFSPEICRGERYDEQSDIWAFGCVLYEMLCLHRPFHQAEGHLGLLALRIADGRYDISTLTEKASGYDASIVSTLKELLAYEASARLAACNALETFRQRIDELVVDMAEAGPAAWWESGAIASKTTTGLPCQSCEATALPAHEATALPVQEDWEQTLVAALDAALLTHLPLPVKHTQFMATPAIAEEELSCTGSSEIMDATNSRLLASESATVSDLITSSPRKMSTIDLLKSLCEETPLNSALNSAREPLPQTPVEIRIPEDNEPSDRRLAWAGDTLHSSDVSSACPTPSAHSVACPTPSAQSVLADAFDSSAKPEVSRVFVRSLFQGQEHEKFCMSDRPIVFCHPSEGVLGSCNTTLETMALAQLCSEACDPSRLDDVENKPNAPSVWDHGDGWLEVRVHCFGKAATQPHVLSQGAVQSSALLHTA